MNNIPSPYVIPGRQIVTPEKIINRVCEYYGITSDKILRKGRKMTYARARQIAIYLLRSRLKMTYPDIGGLFNQHHTTAMYSMRYVSGQLTARVDNDFKTDIPRITRFFC
jgi:chromosomal replication initiator protein